MKAKNPIRKIFATVSALSFAGLTLATETFGSHMPGLSTSAYIGPEGQSHYKQRISEIRSKKALKNGVLFVGDSLTEGCDWNGLLPNLAVRNHGIGWDTSEGVVNRLPVILQNNPDHIFIMIGTNDLANGRPQSEIFANMEQILNTLRTSQSNVRITVQGILPREARMWPAINTFNRSLETMISSKRDRNLLYLDHTRTFSDQKQNLNPSLTYDGLHLNNRGCRLWSDHIRSGI